MINTEKTKQIIVTVVSNPQEQQSKPTTFAVKLKQWIPQAQASLYTS